MRSSEDLLAAAGALVSRGLSEKNSISVSGRSAGGLLVAQSIARAPGFFRCAILDSPLLDPLNEISKSHSPERAIETEWRDSADPDNPDRIRPLSPLHLPYHPPLPDIFVTVADRDPLVPPLQALRWIDRLRELEDRATLLVDSYRSASHEGPALQSEELLLQATRNAFLITHCAAPPPAPADSGSGAFQTPR